MPVEKISFDEAIIDSRQYTKRHLIIGNGFSIACRPDIFVYRSLFEAADFSERPRLRKAFDALETQDFEIVVRNLEAGTRLVPIYTPTALSAAADMAADAAALKEILVSTIAENHPDIPGDIPDEQFWSCRKFLSNFIGGDIGGQVFSLNYDLLLYWTLMHEDHPFEKPISLTISDGFGNDEEEPEAEYVVWQGETGAHSARVHFLHGALHLFDAGNELQKFTWVRSNVRLIDQTREAIEGSKFPLFVAEGTSSQKKSKIRHNAYLYQGFKQFTANVAQPRHCFFVYGHSLAENDSHILRRIGKGRFGKLYVSLYGDPDSESNRNIIANAQGLAALRHERNPLSVVFYDAESANIWGPSA